jgi:hypothetical protein
MYLAGPDEGITRPRPKPESIPKLVVRIASPERSFRPMYLEGIPLDIS